MPGKQQGGASPAEAAPFDDSRVALAFALNADQVSLPSPQMNRAMAEAPVKKRRSKDPAVKLLQDLEAEAQAERRVARELKSGSWPARGLDTAHLAGFIMGKFAHLDRVHQAILTGRLTNPAQPCTCGNPCCSGWLPIGRWVAAVDQVCEALKNEALVIANEGRIPGAPVKVGLSTQPGLRRRLVKDWLRGHGTRLVDLAIDFKLQESTVARHRGWIHEWLTNTENVAWLELDALFDRSGITGPAE